MSLTIWYTIGMLLLFISLLNFFIIVYKIKRYKRPDSSENKKIAKVTFINSGHTSEPQYFQSKQEKIDTILVNDNLKITKINTNGKVSK